MCCFRWWVWRGCRLCMCLCSQSRRCRERAAPERAPEVNAFVGSDRSCCGTVDCVCSTCGRMGGGRESCLWKRFVAKLLAARSFVAGLSTCARLRKHGFGGSDERHGRDVWWDGDPCERSGAESGVWSSRSWIGRPSSSTKWHLYIALLSIRYCQYMFIF